MTESDLKPGDLFRYVDADGTVFMVIDPEHRGYGSVVVVPGSGMWRVGQLAVFSPYSAVEVEDV